MTDRILIRDNTTPSSTGGVVSPVEFGDVLASLPGILLAAALYPTAVSILWMLLALYSGDGVGILNPEGVNMLFLFCLMGGVAGVFVAAFMGLASAAFLSAVNRSLGRPFPTGIMVPITGGLTGYVSTTAGMFLSGAPIAASLDDLEFNTILFGLSSVGLAVLMGQLGATWFFRVHVSHRLGRIATPMAPIRFRIRHLLVATLWCGMLMTLSTIIGGVFGWEAAKAVPLAIPLWLAGWFLFQLPCLAIQNSIAWRRWTGATESVNRNGH